MQRFQRNIALLGRSQRTFESYSRHIAAMALHFGRIPTEVDPESVKDYLYHLQQRYNTPHLPILNTPFMGFDFS